MFCVIHATRTGVLFQHHSEQIPADGFRNWITLLVLYHFVRV